jgi:hypothetical protein
MTLLIVYTGGQNHLKDATDGAISGGRGDDAIRQFARQKFGSLLDPPNPNGGGE